MTVYSLFRIKERSSEETKQYYYNICEVKYYNLQEELVEP